MRGETVITIENIAARAAREEVQRQLTRPVAEAVNAALKNEMARQIRDIKEDLRRQVDDTVARTVIRVQGEVIKEAAALAATTAVDQGYGESLRLIASQASMEALLATRPEFVQVISYEVDRAFQAVTPAVVNVNLPHGRRTRIRGASHRNLPQLLKALNARCHVLLVGPAGTGKSMMALQAADALGLEFHALSLGPTTPMSKVFGYYDANGRYHDTPFRRAFEDGGVMLLDELDNGHPGLLGELNQALALRTCAFADGMVRAHQDFMLVATANTYGHGADHQYVGRQALDAATLDRFTMIDVPVDERLEWNLVMSHAPSKLQEAKSLLAEVRRLRRIAADKRLPLTFSPRAGIDGAKLLEAGASLEEVVKWRVTRGLSAAHRTALGLAPEEA